MLETLAISNYRSLREIVIPLGQLTVITGPNGSGKSNIYRALSLLQETANGRAIGSLAREGGFGSVQWAGPEELSRAMKRGEQPVQGTRRKHRTRLRVGFTADDLSYSAELGVPKYPGPFAQDVEFKREVIWAGGAFHPAAALVDRRGPLIRARDGHGHWHDIDREVDVCDSVLTEIADPQLAPAAMLMRDRLRSWRFYHGFRSDADAPARSTQVWTRTPVLANDGRDVAAALQTIRAIGDHDGLDQAVRDAFPGARIEVTQEGGRYSLLFHQEGLLRPLSQAELSDGTLRYLLWAAALLTPRPPELMVLNEPETSLHPDVLPALGRLILRAGEHSQLWVVTHSAEIRDVLESNEGCRSIALHKELGETTVAGLRRIDLPPWKWPAR